MSEQTLRNPKLSNRSGYKINSKNDIKQDIGSTMTLTKIKNPLMNRFGMKEEKRFSVTYMNLDNIQSIQPSYELLQKKQNINKNVQPSIMKNENLQQPQYRFYADRFNLSSDDSFMLDQSIRESRKKMLEKQIVQKFKNSRKQIQELLRRSRQRRELTQKQQDFKDSKYEDKIRNVNNIVMDKKQTKRKKLKFYHCDSIIIKPQFHPTKVFELSITPTTHYQNTKNFIHQIQSNPKIPREIQADESFSSNSKYESVKKSLNQKFLDSFNQSPLDKLNESKHDFDMDSPSFLDQKKQRSRSNYEQMSFVKDKSAQKKKKIFFQKNDPFQHNKNQQQISIDKRSLAFSVNQDKVNSKNYINKNLQQTIPTQSFKKRNKIFTNDKKSGLKLSRAIRYQEEINKLKGQMGVDVFHIVIQQDEFLRHCCT